MSKWADKLIDAVQFNTQQTHIDKVRCRDDLGSTVSNSTEMLSRFQVIAKIKAGTTFYTIYQENGQWKRGASVMVVKIDGEEFIKTTSDRLKKDNLDYLPRLSPYSSLGV